MIGQYNNPQTESIAASTETGKLQIMHLKRYWSRTLLIRENKLGSNSFQHEFQLDKTLLYTLGLGLEQTVKYVYQTVPTFDEFEDWIIETAGRPGSENIERFNKVFATDVDNQRVIPQILTATELDFWDRNGYVILKNAVPKHDCEQAIEAICRFIGIDRYDPETWYKPHPGRQGIMVQLFQDPILEKNRQSAKIRMAYEQLWNRTDIWVSSDRVGFNPPETENWKFPGPRLHWDVSLQLPIPFGLQGILYLADTDANQGALSLVPGFQHRIEAWINSLPPDTDPRRQDLDALGSIPVVASAGDMIIWHQALPHGSSPNTSLKPRFVQYINYDPVQTSEAEEWK
jgi:hypothetical protein